jgi:hypothetical protein
VEVYEGEDEEGRWSMKAKTAQEALEKFGYFSREDAMGDSRNSALIAESWFAMKEVLQEINTYIGFGWANLGSQKEAELIAKIRKLIQ